MSDDGLLGVSALAKALGIEKGTVSKQAAAGKIPVARRNDQGHPLFDLAAVEKARADNLNPLMRRDERVSAAPDSDGERRSASSTPSEPSALQRASIAEKELKGRKLLGEIVQREGLVVMKSVVDLDQTTMSRRTRDSVTQFLADKASAAYAFAGTPRTEAEWRIWLGERAREAFNTFADVLALEDDDEFIDDPSDDGGAGASDAAAAS